MNEKTSQQIRDEFTQRRTRQRISYFVYLILFMLVFLFREAGDLGMIFLGIFVVYSFAYLAYFQHNWRCPSCDNHLAKLFSKKPSVNPFFHSKSVYCPYCGNQLK